MRYIVSADVSARPKKCAVPRRRLKDLVKLTLKPHIMVTVNFLKKWKRMLTHSLESICFLEVFQDAFESVNWEMFNQRKKRLFNLGELPFYVISFLSRMHFHFGTLHNGRAVNWEMYQGASSAREGL